MKADNRTESNVRVCAALGCPGNLAVNSGGTCPSATLLHLRNTEVSSFSTSRSLTTTMLERDRESKGDA